MDKQTKTEIKAVVREAIQEAMEVYEERWLTDTQMEQYVGVMTQRWLRDHGHLLPRTQFQWEEDGHVHSGSWIYPLHRIQAMIYDGRIKKLKFIS